MIQGVNVSEIKRITRKSSKRCADGRANPALRRDDKYVIDLIYLLEQSTEIIHKLCDEKSPVPDGVLTISGLQDILEQIGDPHLCNYFTDRISEALGIKAPKEPLRIKEG